jgi:hypothetical protein
VNAAAEVTTAEVTNEEVTEAAQDTITMPVAEDGEFFDYKTNLGTVSFSWILKPAFDLKTSTHFVIIFLGFCLLHFFAWLNQFLRNGF